MLAVPYVFQLAGDKVLSLQALFVLLRACVSLGTHHLLTSCKTNKCVCVWQRETERERKRATDRGSDREKGGERDISRG